MRKDLRLKNNGKKLAEANVNRFDYLNIYLFIYLAVSGLSCGTWDLSLRRVSSPLGARAPL